MNKIAQRRSILNQLREKINMPGSYLEGFFKPELDRVMTSLKNLDDRIRSVLTGKQIGNAPAPLDGMGVKDLLKSSRTNFNRREYMAGVADLGRFHKKMFDISKDIGQFFIDVNKIHNKFLFEGLPEGYDEHLKSLKEHMSKKSEASPEYFIKEAGIMDFFYNIGTKRGRSLAAWEKKYPQETKDLREGGEKILNDAQKLLENSIAYLKQMATARALRKPDQYMEIANKMKSDFDKFDILFRGYYEKSIVKWLKINEAIKAEEARSAPTDTAAGFGKGEESGKIELGNEPAPLAVPPSASVPPPAVPPMGSGFMGVTPAQPVPANVPPMPGGTQAPPQPQTETEEEAPDTQRTPMVTSHQRFYESLEAMGQEDPAILAKYISKYAASIQKSDPEVAINLLLLVQQIKR